LETEDQDLAETAEDSAATEADLDIVKAHRAEKEEALGAEIADLHQEEIIEALEGKTISKAIALDAHFLRAKIGIFNSLFLNNL
jgi:hypothetical protein